MRSRAAALAVVLLAACGKSHAPSAKPAPSAVVPSTPPGGGEREETELEQRADRLIECLGSVARDTIWENCVVHQPAIEVVDHVPPIAMRATLHNAVAVLSNDLHVAFEGRAWFRPELVLVDRERAAVTGTFFTNDAGFALPVAATLSLASDGKIAGARIWFDQTRAGHQARRVAPEHEKKKPLVMVARRDARDAAELLVEQLAAAARRDDPTALAALYTESAVFRDESAGAGTVGSMHAARLFGSGKDVAVQQGWAVGAFVVAELRRTSGSSSVESTLEILEVTGGRISQHLSFKNAAHADADSTLRLAARHAPAPILGAGRVTLLKGQPRFSSDKETTPDPVKRHGYLFHREPILLEASAAQRLTAMLAVADSVEPFFGEKKCGGFHPDYSLRWDVSGKEYEALLCFGCGEVKWISPGGRVTRYDLAHWAWLTLATALHESGEARPATGPAP